MAKTPERWPDPTRPRDVVASCLLAVVFLALCEAACYGFFKLVEAL